MILYKIWCKQFNFDCWKSTNTFNDTVAVRLIIIIKRVWLTVIMVLY